MNILERIVQDKKKEVAQQRSQYSAADLQKAPEFGRPCYSLREHLAASSCSGIIAEFKRKSPSKGWINEKASLSSVTQAYYEHGAAGLSILTDRPYFGGSHADLRAAREIPLPILRKDFIIDEYQVLESKAMGADVILLIAACLSAPETARLAATARSLGLEVLLELHEASELAHLGPDISLVGINNRDLKTFQVDLDRSMSLRSQIDHNLPVIAESGIREAETVLRLRQAGFQGFLMGEHFMKAPDPAIAFASFCKTLKNARHEGESLRHDPN